jgi:hypothetical protein
MLNTAPCTGCGINKDGNKARDKLSGKEIVQETCDKPDVECFTKNGSLSTVASPEGSANFVMFLMISGSADEVAHEKRQKKTQDTYQIFSNQSLATC